MIELLLQKLLRSYSREEKFNLTREYLQILILKILSDAQVFQSIAFLGGTALRIIYQLNRYSEDLDFSVIFRSKYDFQTITSALDRRLYLENIPHELKVKSGVIDSCMIHFTSILQEVGIAIAKDQKLSVKLEIDTNPPLGAKTMDSIINSDFIFPVRHYDIPSLMAGKLHAVMFRKYAKGRDFYDLFWYLTRKTQPNVKLLSNSIYQAEREKLSLDRNQWITLLKEKIIEKDFKKIRRDLEPFIHDSNELKLIDYKYFEMALSKYN